MDSLRMSSKILSCIILCCLVFSQTVWAIDPRTLIANSKEYFASIAEERSAKRPALLEASEEQAQALVNQKNALLALTQTSQLSTTSAQAATTNNQTSSTKTDPPLPDPGSATVDDVRNLPPVTVPPKIPIVFSGGPLYGLLNTNVVISASNHIVDDLTKLAKGFFERTAQQEVAIAGSQAAITIKAQTARAAQPFFQLADAVAQVAGNFAASIKSDFIQLGVAAADISSFMSSVTTAISKFSTTYFVPSYDQNGSTWRNGSSTANHAIKMLTDLDYYVMFTGSIVFGAAVNIKAGDQSFLGTEQAAQAYMNTLVNAAISDALYITPIVVADLGGVPGSWSQSISDAQNKISDALGRFSFSYSDSFGSSTIAGYTYWTDYLSFTDEQGNNLTENIYSNFFARTPYPPPNTYSESFNYNGTLTTGEKWWLTNSYWSQKGIVPVVKVDSIYADFSDVSSLYTDLTATKVIETKKPTYWEIRDKATGMLILTVTVPGSDVLSENQNPLGSTDDIILKESYELGTLVSVSAEDKTDNSKVYIVKPTSADQIFYDPSTGVIANGNIVNQDQLDNPDKGFRITMKGGLVDDVFIDDASLYGTNPNLASGIAESDIDAKNNIKKMQKDALQYGSLYNSDNFLQLLAELQKHAIGVGVRGQLSTVDLSSQTTTDNIAAKYRLQAGDYFADPDKTLSGLFNRSLINFSPTAFFNGAPLTILEGQLGWEKKFFQSTLLGIPAIGLFASLKGTIDTISALNGDFKFGAYIDNIINKFELKATPFAEVDPDGTQWVGIKNSTIYAGKLFFNTEFKLKLVTDAEEAKQSSTAQASYLLSKVLAGVYSEQGAMDISLSQMNFLQDFLVSTTINMLSTLYGTVDKTMQNVISDFNLAFTKSRLDETFHTLLHAIPAMTRQIPMSDQNELALILLQNSLNAKSYILPQLPIQWGQGAFEAIIKGLI